MEDIFIPEAVQRFPKLITGDICFVLYNQNNNHSKNRVVFNCNAVSFVLSGKKEIYHASERTIVRPGEATLIPEGNSLIAERTFDNTLYSSLVVFFPKTFAIDFFKSRNFSATTSSASSYQLKFHQTPYLKDYIRSICTLITKGITVSPSLIIHKLEELLLILGETYPSLLVKVVENKPEQSNTLLKKIVENNLMQNLTLEELAFLAHKSLSSFKRDFEKAYGISPGKYMRERKLELALSELMQGKSASQLYLDYGYESLSNFIHAFKKKFKCTPGKYFSQSIV